MYKIKGKYKKTKNLKYISHLDTLRLFQRAVRRAEIPIRYSEGYNPHPKITFAFPLALGIESIGEYFEMELDKKISEDNFMNKMNTVLPEDMKILKVAYTNDKESLMALSEWSEFILNIELKEEIEEDKIKEISNDIISSGRTIKRIRKKKKKTIEREINTKDLIKFINIKKLEDRRICVETILKTSSSGSLKTDELVSILKDSGIRIEYYEVIRNNILNENLEPLVK